MTGFSWISVWALARAMALTFWPVANDGRKFSPLLAPTTYHTDSANRNACSNRNWRQLWTGYKSREVNTPAVWKMKLEWSGGGLRSSVKKETWESMGEEQPRALVSEPSKSLLSFVLSSPTDRGYFLTQPWLIRPWLLSHVTLVN